MPEPPGESSKRSGIDCGIYTNEYKCELEQSDGIDMGIVRALVCSCLLREIVGRKCENVSRF